jgi:hypothetical protein
MGITPFHADLIVREHRRKKLPETVHLLGRQTVLLTLTQALGLIRAAGVEPATTAIEIDRETHGALVAQQEFISDRGFFGLLGVREVRAIDYTDYEGADIILDLTKPLPASHDATVDFVFGGSVLDNIFDPATYLRNVSRLLRPGGRLFEQDVISQHHHPYCLITPAWVFDYFVVNAYAHYAVYVSENSPAGFSHMYGLDPDPDDIISDLGPPRGGLSMGVVVIAEKGEATTSDAIPIQDQYRSADDHARYRNQLRAMGPRDDFFAFAPPVRGELARLGMRTSKSFRYLGVYRAPGIHTELADDANAVGGLRIFEATYGGNCSGANLQKSGVNAVYSGNVTEVLACLFNGMASHAWRIDVNILGDPAPQRGKDLEVFYSDMSEPVPRLRRAYIPAEASGQVLTLPESGGPVLS